MKRILLIEDDYDLARSILLGIELIKSPRVKTEVEYEGVSALVRVQSPPALDLLVLDMHLPNMAGQDIYEAIRQESPDCKVVIVTADVRLAKAMTEIQTYWKHLPAPDAVFTKPFSLIEFVESVKALLKK